MTRHDDPTPPHEPVDDEWAALATAVRDEAPAPRAAFIAGLDERVATGFPRARPAWARRPKRRVLPALAVVATGVLAVTVIGVVRESSSVTTLSDHTVKGAILTQATGTLAPAQSSSAAAGASAASGTVAPSAATASAASARKVERTTSLELATSAGGLQRAADGIARTTQELGGFVASSEVDRTAAGGEATFVLRLPADRLDDALQRFGRLAHLRRSSQGAQDITGTFVSAQRRLTDARQERKALLAALGRASTVRTIASLRARLAQNRSDTARLEGEERGLRRRADFTRVDIALSARGAAAAPHAGSAWGPRDAARDALRVLAILAGVAVVTAAVVLPLGVLGGLTTVLRSGVRRRRRDAALRAG